jgi:hypothetical protein
MAAGLRPFVERELKSHLGAKWETIAREQLRDPGQKVNWNDPQHLLGVMLDQWNAVFRESLGQAERTLVNELKAVRNQWAHHEQFSSNDAIRALDSVERLLGAVSAGEIAAEVGQMRMDLMRIVFDEHRRSEMRKKSFQPTEGKPQGGLKPWREVVTPHSDVASGRYQQAEFAADLWQVYQGEGSDEYKHPTEFFRRTYITVGLKRLLIQALLRLSGKGGDPVVELQTNFGGGKTHSILALYHLFSGKPASELPGVEELVKEAGVPIASKVRRTVFVGTQISPGRTHRKPDGTEVRTVWGEIAWQLGGKAAYEHIRADDERATNPGNALKELFNKYAPCLILIDEWVAYARQLHGGADLPAGTFETQFTFAQALSEAVKAAKQTLLVVSIPASESAHQRTDQGSPTLTSAASAAARRCRGSRTRSDGWKPRGGPPARTRVSRSCAGGCSSRWRGRNLSPAIRLAGRSRIFTARSSRSFPSIAARPITNDGSSSRTRSTPSSSTGCSMTGPHSRNFSARAACSVSWRP